MRNPIISYYGRNATQKLSDHVHHVLRDTARLRVAYSETTFTFPAGPLPHTRDRPTPLHETVSL